MGGCTDTGRQVVLGRKHFERKEGGVGIVEAMRGILEYPSWRACDLRKDNLVRPPSFGLCVKS